MTSQQVGQNARRLLPVATEIVATGYCFPSEVVDNDAYFDRCRFPILREAEGRAAIERESKMRTRYWCAEGESTFTMAKKAVEMALSKDPALKDELDVVLVTSSSTVPVFNPPEKDHAGMGDLAPLLLRSIGRTDAIGFDVKAVNCAGFLRGLQVMDAMLQNSNYRAGLVVSTEKTSMLAVGENNRSTFCFILADAAGAAVLKRGERAPRTGMVDYVGRTDASYFHEMTILPDFSSMFVGGADLGAATVGMLVDCGRTLLARNALSAGDVDWLLPMQTHAALVGGLRQGLSWPESKMIYIGDVSGFSGSASIPATLAHQVEKGVMKKGDLVLALAVGAGLNSAGALFYV